MLEIISDDEHVNGQVIFVNQVNSLTFRNKPTSELHHLLNLSGHVAPNRISVGELKTFASEALAEEPTVMAEVDWEAQAPDKDGKWKPIKLGNKVLNRMANFPLEYDDDGNPTGRHVQTVENPVDGSPVNARLYVVKYLSQAEAQRLSAKA
jgi:hypothetical protein